MSHTQSGIGIELSIESDEQMRRLLKDFPCNLGESVMQENLHVTIMYPEEIARAGISSHEMTKLVSATRNVQYELGRSCLEGLSLPVDSKRIYPYKGHFGIELLEEGQDACNQVRKLASAIINEATGIKTSDYLESYHMSIARRRSRDRSTYPIDYQRHMPSALKIKRPNADIRAVDDSQPGFIGSFVNDQYLRVMTTKAYASNRRF